MAVNTSKAIVRFEAFELDLRAGELRKDGAKPVRLPEQPFLILTMLLEHAGEVVTREEIRKKLWPNDTKCGVRAQHQRRFESVTPSAGRFG